MPCRRHSWDYITVTATSPRGLVNRDRLNFHRFNPNGLCEEKKKTDEEISRLVAEGKAKSGAIIAYGSMNDYVAYKVATKLGDKKKIGTIELGVWEKMMTRNIADARAFVAEKEKGE